jgi:hypothetical protein
MCCCLTIAAALGLAALSSPPQAPADQPNLDDVAKAGAESVKRLESGSATWEVAFSHVQGTGVAAVLRSPAKRKVTATIEKPVRGEMFRIIERDGVWYVSEHGWPLGRFRPYEAPLQVSPAYALLIGSEVDFLTDPAALAGAECTDVARGVATYRVPLPAAQRRQLQAVIESCESLHRKAPEGPSKRAIARRLETARRQLSGGTTAKVNLATGLVVQQEWMHMKLAVREFRWLDSVDEKAFAVDGGKYPDRCGDPTEGADLNDLAMMQYCGAWRAGGGGRSFDCILINVKTGHFRRVPFRGVSCMGGCFLRPRSRVVVAGPDADTGAVGLYEIDLKTCENRRLGDDLLRTGLCVFPALSPDGKTLAFLHKDIPDASQGAVQLRVCLLDLAANKVSKLGRPMDAAFLSWLPDGQGLICITRRMVARDKPPEATIVRMDLTGRIAPLRKGDHPVLLHNGRTILFLDEDRLWKTCDLTGGNVKPFAGGMRHHGFPSPAPDGKRMLWMRFGQQAGPRPVILDVGTAKVTPLTDVPGLWALPAWR